MNLGKIMIFVFLFLTLAFLVVLGMSSKSDFVVYFFNAGKADSCVITKGDVTILIDTGEEEFYDTIRKYLDGHNIRQIDYLIITHFDKDHVGSASHIIEDYEVSFVLQSNFPKESEVYQSYLSILSDKGITPITVSSDMSLDLDDFSVVVNGPDRFYDTNESNNSSLITSVVYGKNKFLFLGDAQNERLKDYFAEHEDEYDLIKVPYHGNYQKQDKTLLSITKPKYAVLSTSSLVLDDKLIELLESNGVSYFVTKDGDITVKSNGERIKISN